jgi:hypothetical protein
MGRRMTLATIGQNWPAPGPNSSEEPQEFEAIVSPIEDNQEPLMLSSNPSFGMPSALWTQRREASLNWLALGLLLAAWNAVDDPSSKGAQPPRARPESLRAYPYVTVRSVARTTAHP